ncbi:MAG: 50S ribosomal protein L9 [Deltaproteobacteria bacterium]|nr:50S ribosomal protein L9 [Deltaproteobacteria bacterium]MBW2662964.1 50S ribosomal protein L9 [Deltaproteobacteria bacterium]
MKLILKETIESLGIIGSEVNVAEGYARNYLLPQKKAVPATPQYRKMMEQKKAKFELQIAKEKEFAEEMAKRLENVVCTISAKVSEEDRLYGSISSRDIVNALASQDIEIEKKMILLSEPIRNIGTFKVPVCIYKEVELELTVEIVPE